MRTIGWMAAAAAGLALATAGAAGAVEQGGKAPKTAAQLEPQDFSAAYKTCLDKADGADFAISACNGEETDRQDKALNRAYRDYGAKLEPERRASLLKAERAWMAYRDAQCELEQSGEAGGTLAKVIYSECLLDLTYDRVQTLKQLLSQETF